MASSRRTAEDIERSRIEGRRQQADLIDEAEAKGLITAEQAKDMRRHYGFAR